jgi:isoquinoline 1-oxidoreductase subunit beta
MATTINTPEMNTVNQDEKRQIGRRGFLASAIGGLSVAFAMPDAGRMFGLNAAPVNSALNAWVNVGSDGTATLLFGGSEMGQGIKTGLAQILAEELMVDWSQVIVQQAPADPTVSYITGGSNAVSGRYTSLRTAGAAAREVLIQAAMNLTGDMTRANYTVASGVITHNGADKYSYASLASAAALLTPPANPPLTDPANFRLIGKPIQRVDIPSKTDGSAKFGIDVWFPDMVFAAIKHCPTIGGTLASLPTRKPSNAIAVVPCKASDDRGAVVAGKVNAVAVVASNTYLAKSLANSLSLTWTLPADTSSVDSTALAAQAASLLATGSALVAEPAPPTGQTPAGFAPTAEALVNSALGTPTVDATYTFPHLAHATMEVLNSSVRLTYADAAKTIVSKCEVWSPTQAATWVVGTALSLINAAQPSAPIGPANVVVNTTFLGGGLGRKIEQDYVSQAIQVALVVKQPVKLTWTREEDFSHDNYRPMAAVRVQASLSGSAIPAWSYRNVSAAILGQRGWMAPGSVDSQAVEGAVELPYNFGTRLTEWVPLPAGIPVGFWRSVGSSINTFAVECTIDELAQKANMDPFAFRYSLISDPRTLAVLQAADALSVWRKSLPTGHAWGLAIASWNGTIVAQVADVSLSGTSLRVNRVACAVDCGQVINPNQAEAQMQGGIVHGLNAALYGMITFTKGVSNQRNFSNYRLIRSGEMPVITVQLVPSANAPSGLGEPAVPPIGPAVANAYSRLKGARVRSLPFFPGSTMSDG